MKVTGAKKITVQPIYFHCMHKKLLRFFINYPKLPKLLLKAENIFTITEIAAISELDRAYKDKRLFSEITSCGESCKIRPRTLIKNVIGSSLISH